uniref:Homeobox protein invected n=1 Tax=Bracon brevicornis TaxID=1563983 RepID=A0A6V7IGU2_9HYME
MEIVNHRAVSVEDSHDQRGRKNKKDEVDQSDCESETSEVLSVGSEPTPGTDSLQVDVQDYEATRYQEDSLSRLDYQEDRRLAVASSRSPSPSPSNDSGSCNVPQSPQSYCSPQQAPSSPTPSSIRSPASSSATASSPSRSEAIQDGILSRYQSSSHPSHQHLLARYTRESELTDYPSKLHGLTHDIPYSTIERLHRAPISVPLATRLSLSPPSSTTTTVNGLQSTVPTGFHPTCRDPREATLLVHPATTHPLHGTTTNHPLLQPTGQQIPHVPATAILHHHHHHHPISHYNQLQSHKLNQQLHQNRLSVSKLLQHSPIRESSSPVSPIRDEPMMRNNLSPGSNSLQNNNNNSQHRNNNTTSSNDQNNSNNNHNDSNDNDNLQGNLKFSIDNILKADFGRRITDPISLKKSRPKKIVQRPIDLTKDFLDSSSESSDRGSESTTSVTNPSPVTTTTSSSTTALNGTTTTSGSDSSKQMLWPAWVYCTRYSDRPSSG